MYIAVEETYDKDGDITCTTVFGIFTEEDKAWAHPYTNVVYRCKPDQPETLVEIIYGE